MQTLLQDLRYGLRTILKSPSFSALLILTLALGIGANTAIFSVVDAVLLRDLPYREPERVVKIRTAFEKHGLPRNWVSEPEWWEMQERLNSFESLAVYAPNRGVNLAVENSEPVRISAGLASFNLFDLLGVQPALGRTYSAEEDQPGAAPVILLSDGLWRRQFGGDADVVGRKALVSGRPATIIGVLPRSFRFEGDNDAWLPLGLDKVKPNGRGSHYLQVAGRLKGGVSHAQAQAELDAFAAQLARENPNNYPSDAGWAVSAFPLIEEMTGEYRDELWVLLGVVGFVLLIACANVANLLLARASRREREVAIRTALGAGRWRIVRQLLTESVLLALAGALTGILLAAWGVNVLQALLPETLTMNYQIALNGRVLLFTLALAVFTGILFGLAPALHVRALSLHESLKEGGHTVTPDSAGGRLRSVLVITEVAVALLLLVGAGLMIRSFGNLLNVDRGFETERILTMRLVLPQQQYPEPAKVTAFYQELVRRVQGLTGVESAGVISGVPLGAMYSSGSTFAENATGQLQSGRRMPYRYTECDWRSASEDYFQTLGIGLVRGRVFQSTDAASAPLVAVVDESFAQRYWPGEDVVGKRISINAIPDTSPPQPQWRTIVGVVRHVKQYGLDKEDREQVYFPQTQFPSNAMYVVARTKADPTSIASAVRSQVNALDRTIPLFQVQSMQALVDASVASPRLNLYLLVAFAGLAMLLAAVGIYGVLSYSVTQRRHEIGVRMALGARPRDVVYMIFGQSMRLAAIGIVLGLAGAFVVVRLITAALASMLFGVRPTDPATFFSIAALLVAVAALASVVPALRATKVDPMVALRYE